MFHKLRVKLGIVNLWCRKLTLNVVKRLLRFYRRVLSLRHFHGGLLLRPLVIYSSIDRYQV